MLTMEGNVSARGNGQRARFFGGLIAAILCLAIAQTGYAAQTSQPPQSESTRQAPFYSRHSKQSDSSQRPRDAWIKEILEEFGRQMNIVVVAAIPAEETIRTGV